MISLFEKNLGNTREVKEPLAVYNGYIQNSENPKQCKMDTSNRASQTQ